MLTEKQLDVILYKLSNSSNYSLDDYARKSITRRMERFMVNHKVTPEKIVYDLSNQDFADTFVEELTVNTTELFRDPKIWQFLRYNTLLNLSSRKNINIWVAGCSTGQEVYSIMILLEELGLLSKSHIIATDINQTVLEKAKLGKYRYRNNHDYLSNFDSVIKKNPHNYSELKDVPYDKYFNIDKKKDEIIMHNYLRNKPIFMKHDLVKGNNIDYTRFDLILCRNVLIYFNQNLQNHVLKAFHSNMLPKSYLVLGIHESILGPSSQLFDKKGNTYTNK